MATSLQSGSMRAWRPLQCHGCGGLVARPRLIARTIHPHSRLSSPHTPTNIRTDKRYASGNSLTRRGIPAQRSDKLMHQEAQTRGEMPTDIGILPGTFITPLRSERPSWLNEPLKRWIWTKAHWKARFTDIGGMVVSKFLIIPYIPSQHASRPWYTQLYMRLFLWQNFETFQLPTIAKSLYEKMYAQLAQGSVDGMRPQLCEPLYARLASRIRSRGSDPRLDWKLHEYIGQPWVVSYKVALFDISKRKGERDSIQQAVVRIRSRQSVAKAGARTPETKAQNVTEYFVIQKMIVRGKPQEWMVWGTAQPTTLETMQQKQVTL